MTSTNEVNENSDKRWERISRDLCRKRKFHTLEPSEAIREFEEAPEVRLSETEIEAIADQVVSGELVVWDTPSWLEAIDSPIGAAALIDGLADQETSVDDDDSCAENQHRLEDEKDPPETPEDSD